MALQAQSPHASTPIPPDAYAVDAPSSRRHYAPQSPQMADPQRSPSSTQSSGRPSQRNAAQANDPTTPQHWSHRSPGTSQTSGAASARPLPGAPTSPRAPAYNGSPTEAATGRHERANGQERPGGPLISPPPRSSSKPSGPNAVSGLDAALLDRAQQRDGAQKSYPRNEATDARRQAPGSPEVMQRPATREGGGVQGSATVQNRSVANVQNASRPVDLSRENSEVISRVVVDNPKIDFTREQERLAESVPGSRSSQSDALVAQKREASEDAGRGSAKRQDFSSTAGKRKETRLGEYILGQTLGEGEFGKVKLGWKKDGSVQVAVKMIRRENLSTNPSRLPKIYREITILGELSHPNIVKLHEMVETDRHIGIIMEYASGGELFDYILTHRYLKDPAARRLFAQLVSGVGYLHKKGIVHRDLKLENLLLDRNRNIIITDFGFANTFNPRDELGEEIEYKLTEKDFVKKMDLERVHNGYRRGDLMQTSCGSPCYAAPELVVTDSLYTGRKVDVWSCGVILYAMLAGYLPFDDDPANPEGDNINLLYKYIVSTPLTFPEYVSPHARDLLRRILVPDPRKRADLFEVARHSWLSEFAHVVAHVTSSTTTVSDIAGTTVTSERPDAPFLTRSASVREPSKAHTSTRSPVGGLAHQGRIDVEAEKASSPRDPKRKTVQIEYVAPQSQTVRGEVSPPAQANSNALSSPVSTLQTINGSASVRQGPAETPHHKSATAGPTRKPPPHDPSYEEDTRQAAASSGRSQPRAGTATMAPPARPARDVPRSVSDSSGVFAQPSIARPNTGGSISSASGGRLPSRGNSYSQPLAPTVAAATAQGSLAQPQSKGTRQYKISNPIPQPEPYIPDANVTRPTSQRVSSVKNGHSKNPTGDTKFHKRSTTLGNFFGKSGSAFGSKAQTSADSVRAEKKYPPVSMKAPIAVDSPRLSTDSKRPSFTFSRKSSDFSRQEKSRRFSLLPSSFSLRNIMGGSKEQNYDQPGGYSGQMQQQARGTSASEYPSGSAESVGLDACQTPPRSAPETMHRLQAYGPSKRASQEPGPSQLPAPDNSYYNDVYPTDSEVSVNRVSEQQPQSRYPTGFNDYDPEPQPRASMQQGRGRVLHKPNRRFADGFDQERGGSSGAAKRVMDFFRRRGKARYGDDR